MIQERLGFARAALQADVPVLPVFTENIRFVTFCVLIHYLNRPPSTIDLMPSTFLVHVILYLGNLFACFLVANAFFFGFLRKPAFPFVLVLGASQSN